MSCYPCGLGVTPPVLDFALLARKYPLPPDLQAQLREDDPWYMRVNWERVWQAASSLIDKYFSYKLAREQQEIFRYRRSGGVGVGIPTWALVAGVIAALYLMKGRR